MSGGSQQLRIFRRAIRAGATLEEACAATGDIIDLAEGKLHLAADAKNPPPPEAFILIGTPSKEAIMAQDDDGPQNGGEYKRPDAKGAIKIYREEIAKKLAHMATIKGDLSDPHKRIKDECNFPRKVLDFLMKLEDMEDHKRDHFLLAMSEGMRELGMTLPRDLVTMADGTAGNNVIPMGARESAGLATLDDDDDDADADEGLGGSSDDFEEASPEELEAQVDRAKPRARKPSVSSVGSLGATAAVN